MYIICDMEAVFKRNVSSQAFSDATIIAVRTSHGRYRLVKNATGIQYPPEITTSELFNLIRDYQ